MKRLRHIVSLSCVIGILLGHTASGSGAWPQDSVSAGAFQRQAITPTLEFTRGAIYESRPRWQMRAVAATLIFAAFFGAASTPVLAANSAAMKRSGPMSVSQEATVTAKLIKEKAGNAKARAEISDHLKKLLQSPAGRVAVFNLFVGVATGKQEVAFGMKQGVEDLILHEIYNAMHVDSLSAVSPSALPPAAFIDTLLGLAKSKVAKIDSDSHGWVGDSGSESGVQSSQSIQDAAYTGLAILAHLAPSLPDDAKRALKEIRSKAQETPDGPYYLALRYQLNLADCRSAAPVATSVGLATALKNVGGSAEERMSAIRYLASAALNAVDEPGEQKLLQEAFGSLRGNARLLGDLREDFANPENTAAALNAVVLLNYLETDLDRRQGLLEFVLKKRFEPGLRNRSVDRVYSYVLFRFAAAFPNAQDGMNLEFQKVWNAVWTKLVPVLDQLPPNEKPSKKPSALFQARLAGLRNQENDAKLNVLTQMIKPYVLTEVNSDLLALFAWGYAGFRTIDLVDDIVRQLASNLLSDRAENLLRLAHAKVEFRTEFSALRRSIEFTLNENKAQRKRSRQQDRKSPVAEPQGGRGISSRADLLWNGIDFRWRTEKTRPSPALLKAS